jgi:hypothetical protein
MHTYDAYASEYAYACNKCVAIHVWVTAGVDPTPPAVNHRFRKSVFSEFMGLYLIIMDLPDAPDDLIEEGLVAGAFATAAPDEADPEAEALLGTTSTWPGGV